MDRTTNSTVDPEIVGIQSDGWDPESINFFLSKCVEGPLFDRKTQLPIIHCSPSNIVYATQELCQDIHEFVRDVISFLNAARRFGRPAYMVFGVKDNWEILEDGVMWSTTRPMTSDQIKHYLGNSQQFQELHRQLIEKEDLRAHPERLVSVNPSNVIRYEFGWLEHKGRHILLSYLIFDPVATPSPFVVKDVRKGDRIWLDKLGLKPGQCWSRKSDSKQEYRGSDIDTVISWKQSPFIPVDEWRTYSEELSANLSRLRVQSYRDSEEIGLQEIQVQEREKKQIIGLQNALLDFVLKDADSRNVLFLIGHGGTGKSTSVQLLAEEINRRLAENLQPLHAYDFPNEVIPVYVDMRHYRPLREPLVNYVISMLSGVKHDQHENFSRVFSDRELKFCVILDAVDEVELAERGLVLDSIYQLVRSYPHTKLIVVCRSRIFTQRTFEQQRLLTTLPLTLTQIIARVKAQNLPVQTENSLIRLVEHDEELRKLLSLPRMLASCVNNLTKYHSISIGVIVKEAVDGYLQVEVDRLLSVSEGRRFRHQLDDLVWRYIDHESVHERDVTRIVDDAHLDRCLECGLLRESEGYITFLSEYVSTYLLGRQLLEPGQYFEEYWNLISQNPDRYAVLLHIMANITNDDITNMETSLGRCLPGLTDPLLSLQIYTEGQRSISDAGRLSREWDALAESINSTNMESAGSLVGRSLEDSRYEVFEATVEALLAQSSLLDLVTTESLEILWKAERDPDRIYQIWPLLAKKLDISTEARLKKLVNEAPLLTEYIEALIDQLDWSQQIPQVVLDLNLLGSNIGNASKLFLLHRIQECGFDLPSPLLLQIENLHDADDPLISSLCRSISGVIPTTKQSEIDTHEEDSSGPGLISSQILPGLLTTEKG